MEIRALKNHEKSGAMTLVWATFLKFEAPDYSAEGTRHFEAYIRDDRAIGALGMLGAFEGGTLRGLIALDPARCHISLFFVDEAWQGQGIGKALFTRLAAEVSGNPITVNASPYAVPIYKRLGFTPTAPEQLTDGIRYTPMVYGEVE